MRNELINISDIVVGGRLRQVDQARVDALKQSISEIGMKTPISVLPIQGSNPQKYQLIAGNHRYEAQKQAGRPQIDAIILIGSDLQAKLWEIDENLYRHELSEAEQSRHLAERKRIYELLHPETRNGGDRRSTSSQTLRTENEAERFTVNAAAATGKSERTVQLKTERGEKVIPEVIDLITGTKLDNGAYLDKLKRLPPSEQMIAARRDLAHQNKPPQQHDPIAVTSGGQPAAAASEKPPLTYGDLRAAILKLCEFKAEDIQRLCPSDKRAPLCQKLAHIQRTCEQVIEAVGS